MRERLSGSGAVALIDVALMSTLNITLWLPALETFLITPRGLSGLIVLVACIIDKPTPEVVMTAAIPARPNAMPI